MSDESRYWKSLRELHDKDSVSELKAHEFMDGVTDDFQMSELSGMSRKQFLALLTASAAFAAAGCSNYRDRGEIVPYTKKPEEVTPGVANYYASTCTGCGQACGVLQKDCASPDTLMSFVYRQVKGRGFLQHEGN